MLLKGVHLHVSLFDISTTASRPVGIAAAGREAMWVILWRIIRWLVASLSMAERPSHNVSIVRRQHALSHGVLAGVGSNGESVFVVRGIDITGQ